MQKIQDTSLRVLNFKHPQSSLIEATAARGSPAPRQPAPRVPMRWSGFPEPNKVKGAEEKETKIPKKNRWSNMLINRMHKFLKVVYKQIWVSFCLGRKPATCHCAISTQVVQQPLRVAGARRLPCIEIPGKKFTCTALADRRLWLQISWLGKFLEGKLA